MVTDTQVSPTPLKFARVYFNQMKFILALSYSRQILQLVWNVPRISSQHFIWIACLCNLKHFVCKSFGKVITVLSVTDPRSYIKCIYNFPNSKEISSHNFSLHYKLRPTGKHGVTFYSLMPFIVEFSTMLINI